MNADGSGETRLTDDTLAFSHLAWSPDGQKIAFSRADGVSTGDIYVVNADGSDQTKLTPTPEDFKVTVGTPLWSPDGQKIAFTAEHIVYAPRTVVVHTICVINADGTDRSCLAKGEMSSTGAWGRG